ncbi:F-box/kelch-repeat protein, partial [Trifolium medium]|nr:F-box/kelch-repeat protein [Trifolium medium]
MNIPLPSQVAALPITLPEELIDEVLSLLTVKSLMRMKCVNKSWNTLISDPIFVKMHLKLSPPNTHFVLHSSCSANILPISTKEKTVTLTDDPYGRFHSKDLSSIVGSCNRLICLLDSNSKTSDYHSDYMTLEHSLYFWNPATRTKSERLGSIRYNRNRHTFVHVMFAFGYDNSTDTYKVVMLNLEWDENPVRTAVKVFTLGANIWRDIDCFPV